MPKQEKQEIVNTVIDVLGLHDIRHSIIGDATKRGISGGQRKRVNIGMELVSMPTVLFLDEPTSGLDSSSSQEVCDALRTVARLGLTVVTVIHQPRYEIFTQFDDVLLLGKGGRTVYLGPTNCALGYFEDLGFECPEHANPADFFLDVISGSVPLRGQKFNPEDLFKLWEDRKNDPKYSRNTKNVETMGSYDGQQNSMKVISQPCKSLYNGDTLEIVAYYQPPIGDRIGEYTDKVLSLHLDI
jgi:ABC-type multidrug transport system ATPase subunit